MEKRPARTEKSKAKLKSAFLTLFQTKEPEIISVKELCEEAGLNRSTFYANYGYMDAWIQEIIRERIEMVCIGTVVQWDLPLEDGGVDRGAIASYLARFLSDPILLRFCTCANSEKYRTLIIRIQVEINLGPAESPLKYYIAYCHNAGVMNLILEWFNNGKLISKDSIIEIIHEFSKAMYRS